MSCPLLRRAHPLQCSAVVGGSTPVSREVFATYCRGHHDACPAYRYLRAAGHPVNAADFRAWVVEGVSPGRVDPPPVDASSAPDGW